MSESDSRLPAALLTIPAPLALVAAFAILVGFSLQRTQSSKESAAEATAVPVAQSDSKTNETRDLSRSPAVEVLRRYLNATGDRGATDPVVTSPGPGISAARDLTDRPLGGVEPMPGLSQQRSADGARPAEKPDAELLRLFKELKGLRDISPLRMQCLIALVPDPIDSHLQLNFDSALAAMARALEQHGYVFDRQNLPWSRELRDRPVTGRPDPLKFRQPGAVLFRRSREVEEFNNQRETCDLLMLLLVGETPTGGIRKQSFCAAMDFAAAWQWTVTRRQTRQPLPVKVLGPTFSGSSHSLRWSLFDWADTRKQFAQVIAEIVSGSATADENHEILNVPRPGACADCRRDRLTTRFESTVIPDSILQYHMFRHLIDTRRIKPEEIAMLVEGNTSYGLQASFQTPDRPTFQTPDRPTFQTPDRPTESDERQSAAARLYGEAAEKWNIEIDKALRLPFPMALSRIRSEYELSEAGPGESVGEIPRSSRSNLKLSLDPPTYATDVLPTFAAGTSAATDLSLEHILASISRRNVRAVGILGTDVLDKLFLAQQVRRHAPNVQIFTFESELLYTHADYAPYLSGTLIASTYPLFTRSQDWTRIGSERKSLQFQSDSAEGIYNATIVLLNRLHPENKQPLIDCAYPFADVPACRRRPAVWLTMASESGLWPVEAIGLPDSRDTGLAITGPFTSDRIGTKICLEQPSCIPALITSMIGLVFFTAFLVANWPSCVSTGVRSRIRLAFDGVVRWYRETHLARWKSGKLRAASSIARLRTSCRWLAVPGTMTMRQFLVALLFVAVFSAHALWSAPTVVFACCQASAEGPWWTPGLLAVAEAALLMTGAALLWVVWTVVAPLRARLQWIRCIKAIAMVLIFLAGWLAVTIELAVLDKHPVIVATGLLAFGVGFVGYTASRPSLTATLFSMLALETLAVVIILTVSMISLVWPMDTERLTEAAIFIERAGTLSSGVSWLVPAVLLTAVYGLWAACRLWRFHLLDIHALEGPFPPDIMTPTSTGCDMESVHTKGFSDRLRELNERLESSWFLPTAPVDWVFLVLLAFGAYYVFFAQWVGTAEGWMFDYPFKITAGAAFVLIAWSQIHVKAVSGLFERLLRRMSQHAMVSAYDRVPERLSAKAAGQIFAGAPRPGDLELSVRCLNQIARSTPRCLHLRDMARDADRRFQRLIAYPRSEKDKADLEAKELNRLFAEIAASELIPRLAAYWDGKDVASCQGGAAKDASAASPGTWQARAELFVAMHFVNLIRQVFTHIKWQLTFLVLMLLCLLCCVHSYPFQPGLLIVRLCYGLILWCLGTNLLLIIRFNRCEVLSRLSGTTPNRFTFDRTFALPMITFVAIPLCSLLAVQFPGIGRMLFGWLDLFRHSFSG